MAGTYSTARVEEYEPPVPDDEAERKILDAAQNVVTALSIQADDQVSKKGQIDDRWKEDTRQFYGRYDQTTEQSLKDNKKSRLFVGKTRAKTNTWEARLSDLLYPTDDRNWGILPTPVPRLVKEAQVSVDQIAQMTLQANAAVQGGNEEQGLAIATDAQALANDLSKQRAEIAEARKRSEAMQTEIDDQFRECLDAEQSRLSIHDLVTVGTGIKKGPVTKNKVRRSWEEGADSAGVFQLTHHDDPRPQSMRVDPWAFFPDMSARTIEEAEFTYQRHLMARKGLKKLAKVGGFNSNAIRRLLETGPRDKMPDFVADLREITGSGDGALEDRYIVWEYHGPLEENQVRDLMLASLPMEKQESMAEAIKVDPLDDTQFIIWFCNDEVLSFGLHPLESGESLYSVANFERDPAHIFGRGVPSLMRDSQAAINGAWRMMMDNGGLSSGSQIVIDQKGIEPVNGVWELQPRKLWYRTPQAMTGPGVPRPFEMFHVESRQNELANIITFADGFADEEASMPLIAEGESGANVTQTFQGMAMLMNAANVVFRRVVKNWDDQMITPTVRRFYDWNMQFNKRQDIKGDMTIDARGSSVLLVRDIQAQNLMTIATTFAGHPVFGAWTKERELYERLIKANQLSPDEIIKTVDQHTEDMKATAENTPPDPEQIKAEVQLKTTQIKADADTQVASMNHQTAMITLATKHNMKLDELKNKLDLADINTGSKERIFAAEVAVEKDKPPDAKGSGGYLS